jgi:hypothetical protein
VNLRSADLHWCCEHSKNCAAPRHLALTYVPSVPGTPALSTRVGFVYSFELMSYLSRVSKKVDFVYIHILHSPVRDQLKLSLYNSECFSYSPVIFLAGYLLLW